MKIQTKWIEDVAITEDKLASNAVTINKIANNSIDENKLTTSVAGNGLSGGNGVPITPKAYVGANTAIVPLDVTTDGLGIITDNDTLENNSGTARVKANGIGSNEVNLSDTYDFATASGIVNVTTQIAGNNTTLVASTAFVQALFDSIGAAIILQGNWNADTNTPDITITTEAGYAWIVEVAGSTDLGGITTWEVGDLAVKTATGWLRINNQDISAVWGNISGTLSSQTDLQSALDGKASITHASTHIDGTDDIQDATALVKGLATSTQITKLDGIEALADVTDSANVNAAGATMNTDITLAGNSYFLDEDDMISDDDTKVASQQSIKSYVASQTAGLSTAQYHVVYVAKDGNDITGDGSMGNPYLTVKAANANISDNSITNRYAIKIAPGIYSEANPIVMKSFVNIYGEGGISQVEIYAANAAANLFDSATDSGLFNLVLFDVTSTAYAIDISSAGLFVVRDCSIAECSYGVNINNATALVDIHLLSAFNITNTMTTFIDVKAGQAAITNPIIVTGSTVTNGINITGINSLVNVFNYTTNSNNLTNAVVISGGADVTLNGARITGDDGNRIGSAIRITGDNTHLDMFSTYIQYADIGVYTNDNSKFHGVGVIIDSCNEGIYADTTGNPELSLYGGSVTNSITWDLYLSNVNVKFRASGVAIDENKLHLDGSDIIMSHVTSNEGDEGLGIKGELHVGSPEKPSESALGEGDSYVRGLLAYTYDGTIYADISDEVKSFSGSTFTFPNNNVNSAIYLGSNLEVVDAADFHKAYGIKISVITAQVGGEIIAEYYNGATWTEFKTMTSESSGNYYRKSDMLFTVTPGSYQVRYNPFIGVDWTKNNDPSYVGGPRYWVRYRIATVLTTAPIFEQWKLHANRFEVNSDGYQEEMGIGRPYQGFSVNWNAFNDAGGTLADQDLFLSTNCKSGLINNNFNSDGDSVGTVFALPPWVDTSAPMKVSCVVVPSASGTLNMIAWLNSSVDGDIISTVSSGTTVGEISVANSKEVIVGEQTTFQFEMDISDKGIEGDGIPEVIWLNIEADSRPGNIYGMLFGVQLLSWREGSHV